MFYKKSIQNCLFTLLTSFSALTYSNSSLAQEPPASCTDANDCAKYIYQTTLAILANVQRFPEFIEAWTEPDDSKESKTGDLQKNFVEYINYTLQNNQKQLSLQEGFISDYFRGSPPSYVNSVDFTTLLKTPAKPEKDENGNPVNSAYNYIKNASGVNIPHFAPNPAWTGSDTAKEKYAEYFKTISAAQSFSTYTLSSFYADALNNYSLSKKQTELLEQASDPDWFASVASESIGVVLRQLLLFNSQIYVMLIKLFEAQQQQLAGQSITNSLLILNSQTIESNLINNASGNRPKANAGTGL